jgi:hypothetical protein
MAEKKVSPMVIVMPFGYAYPPATGVAADKQRTDFEKDLLSEASAGPSREAPRPIPSRMSSPIRKRSTLR